MDYSACLIFISTRVQTTQYCVHTFCLVFPDFPNSFATLCDLVEVSKVASISMYFVPV